MCEQVEIIMIPDKQLAKEMSEQSQKNIQQRIADIGTYFGIKEDTVNNTTKQELMDYCH